MSEAWRTVPGYDGEYLVSTIGRVKSLKYGKERILKQNPATGGYLYVFLCKNNRVKSFRVHRLVALAFIKNPNNLPEVNHKDEDVTNNEISNLEWASSSYNKAYGSRLRRIAHSKEKPVIQLDPHTGLEIARFGSGKQAHESLGLKNAAHIYGCCRGERLKCAGYGWRYAE